MRKLTGFISAVAISASMIGTPAFAAVSVLDSVTPEAASAATEAEMQDRCDALLANFDTGNGDKWYADVLPGDVTYVSGPTEDGSHSMADALGEVEGAGSFTPAHREILGDPYRNGGSPNMFGVQQAVGGYYSASSYDFEGDFRSTFAYGFSCDISVEVYHAAWTEHVPADPNGYYQLRQNPDGTPGTGSQNSCDAFTAIGYTWPQWGEDTTHCVFVGERAHDVDHPESWDDLAFVTNLDGGVVDQEQTDTLLAHENYGEGFSTEETLLIGQVVVCISPSTGGGGKKGAPGEWKQQNGYTGNKCTTAWYDGGAKAGVTNLNTGSHNWVTIPVN